MTKKETSKDGINLTTNEIVEEMFTIPNRRKVNKVYNHYQIERPNEMHQVDLLYLSHDKDEADPNPKSGNFKYALTLVDVASRYKASRPLKSRDSKNVFSALEEIYKQDPYLKYPNTLNADKGSEFQNKIFTAWAKKHNIQLRYNLPSFHLAFVENMNLQLAKKLYKFQNIEEIDTGKISRKWVNILPKIIDEMNNKKTKLIKMKPIDAIQLDLVPQPKNEHSQKDANLRYSNGTKVRRLFNTDEVLNLYDLSIDIKPRRATDPYYSFVIYEVVDSNKHCEDCVYYHTIKDLSTGKLFQHQFTYYELLPTKLNTI